MSVFHDYMNWARSSARILAPKVDIQMLQDESNGTPKIDGSHRGLFANQQTHPGECILFIPSESLLSHDVIIHRGKLWIQTLHEVEEESDPSPTRTPSSLEEEIFIFLEEFRLFVLEMGTQEDAHDNNLYLYREDDVLALYLIAARRLLSTVDDTMAGLQQRGESNIAVAWPCPVDSLCNQDLVTESEHYCDRIDAVVLSPCNQELSYLPFVAMLPQSFPNHPLFFTDQELDLLEGTNCHGFITRMKMQIQTDWELLADALKRFFQDIRTRSNNQWNQHHYHHLLPRLLHPMNLSLDEYLWALSNIYSRGTDLFTLVDTQTTNSETIDAQFVTGNAHHRRIIAPVMDMINHRFDGVDHIVDTNGNVSVYNTLSRTIEPGEEIFLNYGHFGNEKLLLAYGFVIPDNPYDVVPIYAPISPLDPLYSIKSNVLREKCNINDPNDPHLLYLDDSEKETVYHSILPDSLMSTLRLIGLQDKIALFQILFPATEDVGTVDSDNPKLGSDQVQHYSRMYPSTMIPIINKENEYSALQALDNALNTMARRLALNLISDENLSGVSLESKHNSDRLETSIAPLENSGSQRIHDLNVRNIKILVESEYRILIAAIHEIHERMEELDCSNTENE